VGKKGVEYCVGGGEGMQEGKGKFGKFDSAMQLLLHKKFRGWEAIKDGLF
jgi:hypothetical protein